MESELPDTSAVLGDILWAQLHIVRILMSNQEKLDALRIALADIRNLVVKVGEEIQHLKDNPAPENLDWTGVDAMLENLRAHTVATDEKLPDLPPVA